MRATIKDIAAKANISYSTVSRALNNKYGVNPRTREKVLRIADEINYLPNAIARGLVSKQTNTIGLVIPDIRNPFFPEVASGIGESAAENGYNVFLCDSNWSKDREEQYIKLLAERRVDGLIVAPIGDSIDGLKTIIEGMLPVVYVSRAPVNTNHSYVAIDNVRGGFLATKHLIENGYEPIGFIGATEDSVTTNERYMGYQRAFEQYSIPIDNKFIRNGDFKQKSGYDIMQKMIKDGTSPRALFAVNDLFALGAIQAIKDAGLRVPGDIAVVGFDDIPVASLQEVQLTTILQPKFQMGRIAFEMLLEAIESGKKDHSGKNGRKVILEPELIVRKSSR